MFNATRFNETRFNGPPILAVAPDLMSAVVAPDPRVTDRVTVW